MTHYNTTPATVGEKGGTAVEYYNDGQAVFYLGDVVDCLRALPEASAQTVVTSPPYLLGPPRLRHGAMGRRRGAMRSQAIHRVCQSKEYTRP